MPIFMIGISVIGLVWAGKTIYYIYNPPQDQEITFNVVGIINATNSSIVSIYFECIKYCTKEAYSDYNRMNKCYEQCGKLGKIGCD